MMTQLVALPDGTDLSGDYTIRRVLGAGGFGITYLADEQALSRRVSIKEYFPADFAVREASKAAHPRSKGCAEDYAWGLDRFLEEAQTLAKFNHPHIVKVHRIFRANGTAYMVLHFEEGQSLKSWLKHLGRAPRQNEIDTILAPLLDALDAIHKADFLHRDIAPDNIIIRKSGDPVLIDFGAARGELAAHSKTKTVSALVKPGYSPYEQYAESSRQQGPWTDIYALAATLYHAITGKRPPDSPSRMLKDEMVPVRDAALAGYRAGFLEAVQRGLAIAIDQRPQSVAAWRGALLAPEPEKPGVLARIRDRTEARRSASKTQRAGAAMPAPGPVPPPPDVPGPAGGLLDFVDALQQPRAAVAEVPPVAAAPPMAAAPNAKPVKNKKSAAPVAMAAIAPAPPIINLPAVIAAKAATPSAGRRKVRPKPDVAPTRAWARGLKTKLAIAVALTGAVIGLQDHLLRVFIPTASGITTGAIAPSASARSALRQTADFKAHDGAIKAMSLSGDGRLIVTLGQDNLLKVWTTDGHALQGVISLADGAATSLSVRNNRAVVAHLDGVVSVYDLESRNRLYRFKRNDATVWAATFAGSEDIVAAAGHDWTVALWQTASQAEPAALLQGHESAVQTVAVDPAGRWLVSGGADRNVKMWTLDSRDARRTFRNHSDFVSALAFSPDSQTLAAGSLDGVIRLWSISSGRVQRILNAHSARVASLAFSPDGELIASAADDGTVRVRGLRRTRLYWSLSAVSGGAVSVGAKTVAFTNDGASLLTGGDDGVVRVWALPEPRLAQRN